MSGTPASLHQPVTAKADLVNYLAEGCAPPERWRIGTEHEKFAYRVEDLHPLPYTSPDGRSIAGLLTGLERFGWTPVKEHGQVMALTQDGQSITLEPSGQLELSGAPVEHLHQTCAEVNQHLRQVKAVAEPLGIRLIGLGYQPKWRQSDMPWMPKDRYVLMHNYLPTRGHLALDMMQQTCTVQVNLDYQDEADMVQKYRVGLALQPIATALFANSPFVAGRPSGYLSYRARVWLDVDPDRCGIPEFVFQSGMGFERYVDYALDVPMFFVYRNGQYIDATGQSFRDFMAGRLPALPGERPTLGDWSDHLTTLFPEVRMKRFLEMRGADGGPWNRLCALPALWVGLMYDRVALDAAWDLVKDWTAEDRAYLREQVPIYALHTPFKGATVRELALEVLAISREGLRRRDRLNPYGDDEAHFLEILQEIAVSGQTPAEELLTAYEGRWHQNVDPVFSEYCY